MSVTGLLLLSLLVGGQPSAEEKLARARELFQQNRWAEARLELASDLGGLSEKDRTHARFLLGLSYVREAKLYRGLHRFAVDVGLDYLSELAASEDNAHVAWIPYFTGLYQIEAGLEAEAKRSFATASSKGLPDEWNELAESRLGRDGLVVDGLDLDRLDEPDVEDDSDPQKVLRFFDPAKLKAIERVAWENAVRELEPLAGSGTGFANKLARYNAGLSLFFLERSSEAAALLDGLDATSLGPSYYSRVSLLRAAAAWQSEDSSEEELVSLWTKTTAYPETVLLWKEIETPELAAREPFASDLPARLENLPSTLGEQADKTLVGQWGLAEIRTEGDPAEVVRALSSFRNHANKNKIEWNDPLFLTALSAANYRNNDYAQGLETLFELAKTFPGLRGLQWNLQGIYAARQKSAGDARITN